MSRVAKLPIALPKGVEANLNGNELTIKGAKGTLVAELHPKVEIEISSSIIKVIPDKANSSINALAGTTRANINNMVVGVSQGYEKKLNLIGVGYRAQAKGNSVSLSLGYSHPVEYLAPLGVTIETPTQTEILVKGIDRQVVGQVAANIRAYRSPEPYKGKGIRYSDEVIVKKEAKKK
jgi:large subunit ribosomal protein L6